MSGGTPAIANAMPRPPSGGTPKQFGEKPALRKGRPPLHHLGPDSVHDGLVHGLRVSALHSQANPFASFLGVRHDDLGDVRTAGKLFKHLWALCCGPTDGLNARCQIFGNRSRPVRPPSGCPLIPLLTPAVPEVWKVASNVPRRASVHRREPRRRSGGQAGRGLLSLVLPVALSLRPRGKPALSCGFPSHPVHCPAQLRLPSSIAHPN